MSKSKLLLLSLATLFGMGGLGIAICYWLQHLTLASIFHSSLGFGTDLIIGLGFGSISAFVAILLLKTRFMTTTKNYYKTMLIELNLNWFDIMFISFCAGVGEELLFRSAIQYWLGVIPTAIVFVAIHGYLNPKNWKLSIYGIYLTIVMIGVGFAKEYMGIIPCMAAHFIIDVILLRELCAQKKEITS